MTSIDHQLLHLDEQEAKLKKVMEIKEIKPLAMVVNNMIGKKTYFSFSEKRS